MSEEMIDVLDEEDKFVRKASRGDVRKNALLHKTIHVVILNEKGELKDFTPDSVHVMKKYWGLKNAR